MRHLQLLFSLLLLSTTTVIASGSGIPYIAIPGKKPAATHVPYGSQAADGVSHRPKKISRINLEPTLASVTRQDVKIEARHTVGGYISPIQGRYISRGPSRTHHGVDISAPSGTKVLAVKGGIVIEAKRRRGYGLQVLLSHGSGESSRYAHLKRSLVSPGQRVARGSVIGLVGRSGNATAPSLHFELRGNNSRALKLVESNHAHKRVCIGRKTSPLCRN